MADEVDRRVAIGRELLGARLRAVRIERGLTVLDLAGSAGVHKTYVSKVEHGQRLPTLEVLDSFALALQVNVTQLLAGLFPWDSDVEPAEFHAVTDGRRRAGSGG